MSYKKTNPNGITSAYFSRKEMTQRGNPDLAQKCHEVIQKGCACGGVVCVIRDPLVGLCERCDRKRKDENPEGKQPAKRQCTDVSVVELMCAYIKELEESPLKTYAQRIMFEGSWALHHTPGCLRLDWDTYGHFAVQGGCLDQTLFEMWRDHIVKFA